MNAFVVRCAVAGIAFFVGCSLLRGQDDAEGVRLSKRDASFPIHADHIFNGGINSRDSLVGCHHKPSAPKQMRVDGKMCDVEIEQTSPGSESDVVTAKVILTDPESGRVVREKFSTLFPSAWTKDEIEHAIRVAYVYAKAHGAVDKNGAFHGKARNIKIDGYLTARGDAIATAYPVYQGSQSKSNRRGKSSNGGNSSSRGAERDNFVD